MTTLIERLRADTKAALFAKDAQKRTALSTLTAEAERAGLDDRKRDSTDAEVEDAIRESIKNGNKTLASLAQLGDKAPTALREKTEYKLALYATYLPKQASDDEVRPVALADMQAAWDALMGVPAHQPAPALAA